MALEDAKQTLLDIDNELNDYDEDNLYYAGIREDPDFDGHLILSLDYEDEDGNFRGNVEEYTITITPRE